MIGAKEGVVKAIMALVGTNITNSVLITSDGNFKSVDDYTVHKVMQAAFENADRPPMTWSNSSKSFTTLSTFAKR